MLYRYKIRMKKDVCCNGRTLGKGEIVTINTDSDFKSCATCSALIFINGSNKTLWWDEFEVVEFLK